MRKTQKRLIIENQNEKETVEKLTIEEEPMISRKSRNGRRGFYFYSIEDLEGPNMKKIFHKTVKTTFSSKKHSEPRLGEFIPVVEYLRSKKK